VLYAEIAASALLGKANLLLTVMLDYYPGMGRIEALSVGE